MKKICVTRRDIKEGTRKWLSRCPIALAAKRAFGTNRVSVSDHIVINGKFYTASPKVLLFIDNFDRGRVVEPFSFVPVLWKE